MMDILIVQFNAWFNVAIALALAWAVLSQRVSDGIVIKGGLILMALGFGSKIVSLYDGLSCGDMLGLARSNLLVHVGVVIAVVGYLLRRRAAAHKIRRATDWAEFDSRPMEPRA